MMSVHDALQAWQEGQITSRQAMALTGATNIVELYSLAQQCDVPIRRDLNENEKRVVELVTQAIRQRTNEVEDD